MIIQSSSFTNTAQSITNSLLKRQDLATTQSSFSEKLSISQEAKDVLAKNEPAKTLDQMTASEIDALQKSHGMVNTFAYLSPTEKQMYDDMVASGNHDAAAAISNIALIRQGGEMAGGANGTTYNPRETAITAKNVMNYFSHSIVDASGETQKRFQALIQYLQNKPSQA